MGVLFGGDIGGRQAGGGVVGHEPAQQRCDAGLGRRRIGDGDDPAGAGLDLGEGLGIRQADSDAVGKRVGAVQGDDVAGGEGLGIAIGAGCLDADDLGLQAEEIPGADGAANAGAEADGLVVGAVPADAAVGASAAGLGSAARISGDGVGSTIDTPAAGKPPFSQPFSIAPPILPAPARTRVFGQSDMGAPTRNPSPPAGEGGAAKPRRMGPTSATP